MDKVRYKGLINECFRKTRNYPFKDRLKLLTDSFKEEVFLNPNHKERFYRLLFENLGIMIPEERELKILKLYMPLTVHIYEIENQHGYGEISNKPIELDSSELIYNMDEILEAIEKGNLPGEE